MQPDQRLVVRAINLRAGDSLPEGLDENLLKPSLAEDGEVELQKD